MPSGTQDYGTDLTFPLTPQQGGTGLTGITLNGVVIGNGTSPVQVSAAGVAFDVFQVPSGGGAPAFGIFPPAGQGIVISPAVATIGLTVTMANGSTAAAALFQNNSGSAYVQLRADNVAGSGTPRIVVAGGVFGIYTQGNTGSDSVDNTCLLWTDAGGHGHLGLTYLQGVAGGGTTPAIILNSAVQMATGDAIVDVQNFGAVVFQVIAKGIARLKPITVADLPAPTADYQGGIACVTDATNTTYQGVVAGTGANVVMVFCDGTNWRIF